jgi:sugar-specific transcriptional regulator TrmB
MDTNVLEKLGLTANEISVYLALLELGTVTTGAIVKKSNLHTSRVYESLEKLVEKGLVSFVIKSNKKHFSASSPEHLIDILEEQKKEVNEILPQLKALNMQKQPDYKSTIYDGYKGVKSVYDNIIRTLKPGDEILVFGARAADDSFMAKTYFKQYTQRRVEKQIKMKIIFNDDARETGKFYSELAFTEVRYMPKDMKTPAAIDIYGNNVGTLVLNPQPIVFLISSKEVADSYREFFRMLWKMCK